MSGSDVAIGVMIAITFGIFCWLGYLLTTSRPSKAAASSPAPFASAEKNRQPQRTAVTFDQFMDRLAKQNQAKWLCASLAGITNRNEDGSVRQEYIAELSEFENLQLVHEPDNVHDANAVAALDLFDQQVGYIPAWLARDVGPALASDGGVAECYVQHLREVRPGVNAVAVGVLWRKGPAKH